MEHFDFGQATVSPNQPGVAGAYTTLTYTYTAGHPIDDSGYVKITFRIIIDMGVPQFEDPTAPNYCSVATTGNCKIVPRWDNKGHQRPWSKTLFLKVRGGFLDRGEQIQVVFGDTSGGSPGWQLQTYCDQAFEFKTFVDPISTYQFKELPESPQIEIIAGEAVRATCLAPSQVVVNQPFDYFLKLDDRWGNPVAEPLKFSHPGWEQPGIQSVTGVDEKSGLRAASNPIKVSPAQPAFNHYWADFHGQTEETVGTKSIEAYFAFARDVSRLDIAGHQGNDFQITDDFWARINRTTQTFYQPGKFVTFPGYEWSGNTPLGGDRNVFFFEEGGQITRSSHDLLPAGSPQPISPTANDLFRNLAEQTGPTPFVFAHVGGRYADIRMHDEALELSLEIHSAWGTFEWLAEEAFARGYRMGIGANSDGHKGRPGASYPGSGSFGSLGGLTCVLAAQLDREHIFDALKKRHFYATTGNRPLLDVTLLLNDSPQAMMGDLIAVKNESVRLQVRAVGSGPIEQIEVRNGAETLQIRRPYTAADLGSRLKIIWSGAEVHGRDRIVRWDGGLQMEGNQITAVEPINFWNSNQPLKQIGTNGLAWQSVTTGGVAGVILALAQPEIGQLAINTLQQDVSCEIADLSIEPKTWACGGLQKQLQIVRLPDQQTSHEFEFTLNLDDLHPGDNPIYVRVVQEDGHMAWSSPIYVVK